MEQPIEPYRKKRQMQMFEYAIKDIASRLDDRKHGEDKDLAWMMCHAVKNNDIAMWVGLNSLLVSDPLPIQNVLHMKNINQPITSNP